MKSLLIIVLGFLPFFSNAQEASLVEAREDGRYTLSSEGASYFAKLSLECAGKSSPHFIERVFENRYKWSFVDTVSGKDYWPTLRGFETEPSAKDLWPSFYGCFDWHSSVHNHWCLVKLLKKYPEIPEADAIREKLKLSFNPENIAREIDFVQNNEYGLFEFPMVSLGY